LVQRQIGCVEEEHLPDLGFERVESERFDRGALRVRRQRQLQFDAVRAADQSEQLRERLTRQLGQPFRFRRHLDLLAPREPILRPSEPRHEDTVAKAAIADRQ
jgi:hypothetical protein